MEKIVTKSILRKTILHYRRLLPQECFNKRNTDLLKNLQHLIREKNPKTIHSFLPISRNKEVDITPLFSEWRNLGMQIIVSKTDFHTRKMNHFFLEENTTLVENYLGIPEPVDATKADIFSADIILVPLLVADKNQNRIGYGGGFYDELLRGTKALKVGLSLSSLLDEILQKDKWDISLDYIISHKKKHNG